MVVAGRAAGGERVTQPEAVRLGDLVGDVGERRGALVGGDHHVRVVAVVPDHVLRRHDLAADDVVGDVEQRGDELLVADHRLVPVARLLLEHEAALGADRHDHRVLHHLRLDQAEHLGPEVLAPVGPAQAAAGHRPVPQVHALEPGRVDEDLELGPRRRQVRDGLRVQLERHVRLGPPAHRLLVEAGAQRGLDQRQVGPQDAVLVEAGHLVQRLADRVDQLAAALPPLVERGRARGEPGLEQLHQQFGDLRVRDERLLHVLLGEHGSGLPQVLRVRAQHDDLPPGEPGPQHQLVEAVHLGLAPPGGGEGVLHVRAHLGQVLVPLGQLQTEVVEPDPAVDALHLVRVLVDHLHAERVQHRQHGGEHHRLAVPVDLEPDVHRVVGVGGAGGVRTRRRLLAEQVHLQLAGLLQQLQLRQVLHRLVRRVPVLVALRERVGVPGEQVLGLLVAELAFEHQPVVVVPEPGRVGQFLGEQVGVDVTGRVVRVGTHDEVHPGQHRLGHPRGVVDADAVQLAQQDVLHAQPVLRGEPVPRQVDQAGDEPPVRVAAQEHPQLPPTGHPQHADHRVVEVVGLDLEQLVARVGLQDLQQVLAGVAAQAQARAVEHLGDLPPHHRQLLHAGPVRGGGEQAQEAPLPDHLAGLVEDLEADVVEVRRAVHRGTRVGLGDDEQALLQHLLVRLGRHRVQRPGLRRVGAQDAQPGAEHRLQCLPAARAVGVDQAVLPVAEEREVVVRQPAQQLHRVGDVLLRHRRAVVRRPGGGQLVGEREGPLPHLRPVLDRLAHVGEHPLQLTAQRLPLGRVADRVDLDPHPALDQVTGDGVVRFHVRRDLGEPAQRLAPHHDQRVHQQVHVQVTGVQQGGHRVDQERHVVGDDLDDRVVLLGVRLVDAELQLARHPLLGQVPVGPGRLQHLLGGEADQLLVRREPPEAVHQCGRVVVVAGQRDRLGDQPLRVGNGLVQLGVLRLVGQCLRRQAQVVEGVDAGTGHPGHSCVETAETVSVGRRIEAVVVPAGVSLPEVGSRFDRRTPVHRCHSPRPTALWVTLPPSLGPTAWYLPRRTTGRTSG